MIVSRQSSIFEATLLKFSFKLHRIFDFRACACAHPFWFPPPPRLPLPSKLNWHSPHTPPALVPPPSTPSQENFRFLPFSALGLHPPHLHHPPTLPGLRPHLRTLPRPSTLPLHTLPCTSMLPLHPLPCTSALPLHTFRTPSVHPCALCAPSSGFVTLIRLSFLTSDPLPATMGNPALVQLGIVPTSRPLYNQVQPLRPPCCPSIFPVGLHNPHSRSRTWSGSHTTHPMAHGW